LAESRIPSLQMVLQEGDEERAHQTHHVSTPNAPMIVPFSPTSPVGTGVAGVPSPPCGADDEVNFNGHMTGNAADQRRTDATEPVYKPGVLETLETDPRPLLLIGPGFDKSYALNANRWVKVGRSKKAQLLLVNTGVSRNHCSFRWDCHRRLVELKDMSASGTLVNGTAVKGERHVLAHGDRLRVEGKGARYDFILDLRPVNGGITDPREEQGGAQHWRKLRGPALIQRRDHLKSQLDGYEQNITRLEKETFEKEKEFYEIATRRSLRTQEDKQRKIDLEKYILGAKELEFKLNEGRDNWLSMLQTEYDNNEKVVRPIMDSVAALQIKVEKLQLKKDELERTIHPEKYAVADVSRTGSFTLELPTPEPSVRDRVGSHTEAAGPLDDIEGEEEAFADMPGMGGGQPTKAASSPVKADLGTLERGFADEPQSKRLKAESPPQSPVSH